VDDVASIQNILAMSTKRKKKKKKGAAAGGAMETDD